MTNFLLKAPLRLRLLPRDLQKFAENSATTFLRSLSSQSTNNGGKDSAPAAAKRTHLKPTADPGSVRALFASYGFAPSDAESIFSRYPVLLSADPDRTLKPKLQFLSQNSVLGLHLVHVISRNPFILGRSLDKQIVPCIDFLRNFFGSDGIVSHLSARRGTWILQQFSESVAPNVERLRAHGVPHSNIAKLIMQRPRLLSRDAEEFGDIVEKTKEAGFSPKYMLFICGMWAFSGVKEDKWLSKLQVFKSFGWSEEQFWSMFLKQPRIMYSSEEKVKRALDFCTNKLEWTAKEISKYPNVLCLSFEKRIIPRWSILQHLISKEFIKKTSVGQAFKMREDKFLVKFVKKYLSEDPHLLEMYQKKMAIL